MLIKKEELTKRELGILHEILADQTNGEIAKALQISIKTVEKHRQAIYGKLGCNSVMGMVRKVLAKGLFPQWFIGPTIKQDTK